MKLVIKRNLPLLGFLFAILFFLLIANSWFWPTPDEYLYAAVARSILAGFKGEICLSCFNTEHTYLVSAVVAVYQGLATLGDFELIAARLPVIFFSLATIYLIWLIAGKVVENKDEQSWLLWFLLLIPGYFVLSTRLMLDVPLTFGFAVLIYLLIIRARPIWIGMALLLILLTKDYGWYLAIAMVAASFIFDVIEKKSIWLFVKKTLTAFVPSLLGIILLLGVDLLPYPRLLETGLIEVFGGGYGYFAKNTLITIQKISPVVAPTVAVSYSQEVAEKIPQIATAASFPHIIFDSPIQSEITGGFFKKLWLIYKFNFSEQDVMIFALPLFFAGLTLRVKSLIAKRQTWFRKRADLIFLVLFLIFAYVNWHEALNLHGFRLTTPVTLALVYFGYFGARAILVDNDRLAKRIFGGAFLVFLALYVGFVLNISSYGSVIASQGLTGWLVRYKLFFFITLFALGFLFVWHYHSLRLKREKVFLGAIIIALFAIKFLPFYLESRAAAATFEYDYGLPKATTILHDFLKKGTVVATNTNAYTMDYYAKNLNLPNEGSFPVMRILKQEYLHQFLRYRTTSPRLTPQFLVVNNIQYIFFANREVSNQSFEQFQAMIEPLSPYLRLFKEERHPLSGRLQWLIYEVNLDNLKESLPKT